MNVLISIDMEGVAGIATRGQVIPGRPDYQIGRALMTGEANAAAAGAFDSGARSVLVNDSHGPMDNLLGEDLDRRVEYVVGSPKPLSMMQGLDDAIDVALFVGYHAGPQEEVGVLAHSFSGLAFADLKLNGEPLTELGLNTLLAASRGVPVGLVTGDDAICRLAEKLIPGVVTVQVKTAIGITATRSLTPTAAREAIQAGAAEAVAGARDGRVAPVTVPPELVLEATFRPHNAAEAAVRVPGSERVAANVVRQAVSTPQQALDLIFVWGQLTAAYVA
jgi:D-amino peptidase